MVMMEDDDDDLIASTGATRDTRTLRAALEVTPDDDELRQALSLVNRLLLVRLRRVRGHSGKPPAS